MQNYMHNYTHTYSLFIICTEFQVARMKTKFSCSCP
jgi:hypothetical protein